MKIEICVIELFIIVQKLEKSKHIRVIFKETSDSFNKEILFNYKMLKCP